MSKLEIFFARLLAAALIGCVWGLVAKIACWVGDFPVTWGQAWAVCFGIAYAIILYRKDQV